MPDSPFDVQRTQFPIFQHHPDLIYFDNAATTQKPQSVIDAVTGFYAADYATVHRGAYRLANQATKAYEAARQKVAHWQGVRDAGLFAFTSGTTGGINAVAQGWLAPRLKPGDNIVTTNLEHHANLLPWQLVAQQRGAELRIASVDEHGILDYQTLAQLIDRRTRMVAISHISNVLGSIQDLDDLTAKARNLSIPVLIDGAQSAAFHHHSPEVFSCCAFWVCSAHKLFGPTGVGILYAGLNYADFAPCQVGGGMVKEVGEQHASYVDYPGVLEAGTPNVAGIVGLGAALDWLGQIDRKAAAAWLEELTQYALELLRGIAKVRVVGAVGKRGPIIPFVVEGIHPHDVATFLDQEGIALRAGLHCCEPLHRAMGLSATLRVSFSIYNTQAEVDHLAAALRELIGLWHG